MYKCGAEIKEMLLAECKYKEICNKLQVAKSTVAYHARMLKLDKPNGPKPIYDWKLIQEFYDKGHCNSEVSKEFNVPMNTIRAAGKDGRIILQKGRTCKDATSNTGGYKTPSEEIFKANSDAATMAVKRRIKAESLMNYCCSNIECILFNNINASWAGKSLVLHLDHINGIRNDHRLENLRWLCANCHTQTETYCGRNKLAARP